MQARTRERVKPKRPVLSSFVAALILLIAAASFSAQTTFPDKIRGYKVHKSEVQTEPGTGKNGTPLLEVRFAEPEFSEIGLDGIVFTVGGDVLVNGRQGKVHFLSFHDFTVDGIPVEIRDHNVQYEFRSGQPVTLKEPIEIVLGFRSAAKAAAGEIRNSKPEWEVAGTVFVFGKFKWSLFSFRRVVPVRVNFRIPNPLSQESAQDSPRDR